MRRTGLLLAIGIVAAGCSGSNGAGTADQTVPTSATVADATTTSSVPVATAEVRTTSTTTTTIPMTTEAPTTTFDPLTAGQLAYFGISSELNARLFALYDEVGETIELSEVKHYCQVEAEVSEEWTKRLKEATWPSEAQAAIDEMIASNAASAGLSYACANARTNREAMDILNSQALIDADVRVNAAASAVRVALNLPIQR